MKRLMNWVNSLRLKNPRHLQPEKKVTKHFAIEDFLDCDIVKMQTSMDFSPFKIRKLHYVAGTCAYNVIRDYLLLLPNSSLGPFDSDQAPRKIEYGHAVIWHSSNLEDSDCYRIEPTEM
jgi:hypothetical protein